MKLFLIVVVAFGLFANAEAQDKAKVVFISGSPSHGRMEHEHRAGNMLGLTKDQLVAVVLGSPVRTIMTVGETTTSVALY